MENNKNFSVVAVIVTYNRKALLQECLQAVLNQTHKVKSIVVIDNASTDGTETLLSEYTKTHNNVLPFRMEKNVGGSGGFSEGIKKALKINSDWIWLMDDDTIPSSIALEKMLVYSEIPDIGFLNSMVLWKDGNPHLMNIPPYIDNINIRKQYKQLETGNIKFIPLASFVSLLIRSEIPLKLGLPYKEFFIWYDDAEYTSRIYKSGYIGLQVLDSIVMHKTPTNYTGSLKTITADKAWKLYYGERNDSFLRKQKKGFFLFFFSQLNAFRLHRHKIIKRKLAKEDQKKLIHAAWHGLWDGITFSPKIEYIK